MRWLVSKMRMVSARTDARSSERMPLLNGVANSLECNRNCRVTRGRLDGAIVRKVSLRKLWEAELSHFFVRA